MERSSGAMPITSMAFWGSKRGKNSMLNQDHSGGLLTPAVPSSCSLITPVVVSLVNKNRRRSLKKKKGKKKTREECYWETVSHMNTGMRFTDKHNTTDSQADRKSLTVPLSPGSRSCRWCRPLCRSQTDWGNCSNPGLWFPGYSSAPRWLLLSTVEQKLSLTVCTKYITHSLKKAVLASEN